MGLGLQRGSDDRGLEWWTFDVVETDSDDVAVRLGPMLVDRARADVLVVGTVDDVWQTDTEVGLSETKVLFSEPNGLGERSTGAL